MDNKIKFTVENRSFTKALKSCAKIINTKNALPILGDVVITVSDNTNATMTAGNGEAFIQMPIAGLATIEGPKDYRFALSPFDVKDVLANINADQVLTIEVDMDKPMMTVGYLQGKFSVPVERADEYPAIPTIETHDGQQPLSVVLPAQWLLREVGAAKIAVASEELRPVMNAVCLDVDVEGVCVVASDGHKLYKNRLHYGLGGTTPFILGGQPQNILLDKSIFGILADAFAPAAALDQKRLAALASADDDQKQKAPQWDDCTVTITTNGHHVSLSIADGTQLSCLCCEQRYPNWRSVIPQGAPYSVTVEREAIVRSIKRVQPFASDSSQLLRIAVTTDPISGDPCLRLTTEDYDFSKTASESVTLQDSTAPDGFAIGVKASSLLEVLGTLRTENAVINLTDSSRAITIQEEDKTSHLLALVMPMLLNEK
ncbi:MAG: hypothetical protein IKR31_03325 [Prevotella sp.]|nr:hypothetical protein [Prevotella sp.]